MTKVVRMVAEILAGNCTGCALCVYVCPTVALTLRDRRPDEAGTHRRIAELAEADCYNAQNCMEICPDEAIVMHHLAEPFTVGTDVATADADAVRALCRSAGIGSKQLICMCAETTGGELAAAVLAGAHTPEAISLATGARTGCTELCHQPIIQLLAAAGHGDLPRNPPRGFQWYGLAARALDLVADDGTVAPELVEAYSQYPLVSDLRAMRGDFSEFEPAEVADD
ncbi:MAG: (2Fe-2S)-binding protein [Ilumatobacteraceae bacterium]